MSRQFGKLYWQHKKGSRAPKHAFVLAHEGGHYVLDEAQVAHWQQKPWDTECHGTCGVSFNLGASPSGRLQLLDVKLLQDEDDRAVLEACFNELDGDYWLPVGERFLGQWPGNDLSVGIRDRIINIPAKTTRSRFVNAIPDRILLSNSSSDLRPLLPIKRYLPLVFKGLLREPDNELLLSEIVVILVANQFSDEVHEHIWRDLLPVLPLPAAIKLTNATKTRRNALLQYVPDSLLFEPGAFQVRRLMTIKQRWTLFDQGCEDNLEDAILRQIVNELPDQENDAFWSAGRERLNHDYWLFGLAPENIRKKCIAEMYAKLTNLWPTKYIDHAFPAQQSITCLTEKDRQLASIWVETVQDEEIGNHIFAQMLSARSAEKLAKIFYQRLGHSVQDVAIGQLSDSTDWRLFDLLIDGEVAVDVKNARNPYNNPTSYVEHLVPRFKHDRNLEHVQIAGVVSPYIGISSFENGNVGQHQNVQILGQMTWNTIRELEEYFSDYLTLNLVSKDAGSVQSARWSYVIPPWMFDYPETYYSSMSAKLTEIEHLANWDYLTPQNLARVGKPLPIPLFIAAQQDIPMIWRKQLTVWQLTFFDKLVQSEMPISLPLVYLTVLSHFTMWCRREDSGYTPTGYYDLLYLHPYRVMAGQQDYPAGRRDPLGIVSALIKNLEKLWELRKKIRLAEFAEFSFQGLGVLRGRRRGETRFITLFAYCGGRTVKQVKCGYPDLVWGTQGSKPCPQCGRLICPKCEFCKHDCERYLEILKKRRVKQS